MTINKYSFLYFLCLIYYFFQNKKRTKTRKTKKGWDHQWTKMALKMAIISYMGIRFLAITRPYFVQLVWNFSMVTQETIIYRLVIRNHDFYAFLKKYIFLAGKWAWPPRWRQMDGAHRVELLGQPLSRKPVFENFRPEHP